MHSISDGLLDTKSYYETALWVGGNVAIVGNTPGSILVRHRHARSLDIDALNDVWRCAQSGAMVLKAFRRQKSRLHDNLTAATNMAGLYLVRRRRTGSQEIMSKLRLREMSRHKPASQQQLLLKDGTDSEQTSDSDSDTDSEIESEVATVVEPVPPSAARRGTGVHLLSPIGSIDLRQQIIFIREQAEPGRASKRSRVDKIVIPVLDDSLGDANMGIDVLVTYQRQNYVALLTQRGPAGRNLAWSRPRGTVEGALHSLLYLTALRLQKELGDVSANDKNGGWLRYENEEDDEDDEDDDDDSSETSKGTSVKASSVKATSVKVTDW
nr:hypothetical protein CFP56_48775 [Quercus suber]